MDSGKKVTGIILLAGNSTRYGKNINKNFEILQDNNTVISYSIRAFHENANIHDILLVIRESDKNYVEKILAKEKLNKPIKLVIGGSTRQESVYNAIITTTSDIVLIHDGARPLIRQSFIDECIQEMKSYKGVTVGVKAKDTIKIVNDSNEVVKTTLRTHTRIIQTPQCFDREVLLSMHIKYKNDNSVTDDCMLLEKENYPIKVIEGDYSNIKITTIEDIDFVRGYLESNQI